MTSLAEKSNEKFFEIIKIKYPHLATFNLDNNILSFHEYKINLGNFRLIYLNEIPQVFSLNPFEVYQIIKIHTDVEEENNYLIENEYNKNTLYLQIRAILVKNVLDGNDLTLLNNFISAYKILLQNQDFLLEDAKIKFINMQNVIRENLNNPDFITLGIIELMKGLNLSSFEDQNRVNNDKVQVLTLKNPKFKSEFINQDEEYSYGTGTNGFANIFLILYIILNIGFILAVMLIK